MRKRIRARRVASRRVRASVFGWAYRLLKLRRLHVVPLGRSSTWVYCHRMRRHSETMTTTMRSPVQICTAFWCRFQSGFIPGSVATWRERLEIKFLPARLPHLEKDSPESEGVKERGSGRLVPELLRGNIVRRKWQRSKTLVAGVY